jgi:hypothetical protein
MVGIQTPQDANGSSGNLIASVVMIVPRQAQTGVEIASKSGVTAKRSSKTKQLPCHKSC